MGKKETFEQLYMYTVIVVCLIWTVCDQLNAVREDFGRFPFTSPRRQTGKLGKRLFTLPKSPAGDVLSINSNSDNAGDTGFAGLMESALYNP